jgi:hypothetical protein
MTPGSIFHGSHFSPLHLTFPPHLCRYRIETWVYCSVVKSYSSRSQFGVIDSFLQELHSFILDDCKNFSVFYTNFRHLCRYRIETWYIVFWWRIPVPVHWIIFVRAKSLSLRKIFEFDRILDYFFFDIFAAFTLKFGLPFCSKEFQFQFAFQWDWFIIY